MVLTDARWEVSGPLSQMDEDPCLTRIGRVLRTSCRDALPESLTLLRGNMSVVGPRPYPEMELDEFPVEGLENHPKGDSGGSSSVKRANTPKWGLTAGLRSRLVNASSLLILGCIHTLHRRPVWARSHGALGSPTSRAGAQCMTITRALLVREQRANSDSSCTLGRRIRTATAWFQHESRLSRRPLCQHKAPRNCTHQCTAMRTVSVNAVNSTIVLGRVRWMDIKSVY